MFEPRRCAPSSEGAERYGHLLDSIRFVARGVLEKHHLRICGRARSSPCGRRATGDQMRILYGLLTQVSGPGRPVSLFHHCWL
jgi:hypothetical protein